jgi:hypothetical protein
MASPPPAYNEHINNFPELNRILQSTNSLQTSSESLTSDEEWQNLFNDIMRGYEDITRP